MASLTYRIKPQVETGVAPKGTPLTNLEIDDNFYNIDTEVHEKLDFPSSAGLAVSTNGDEASVAREITVSGDGISITNGDGVAGNPAIALSADTNNTPNSLVYRDASGDFTANTVRANLIAGNVYLDVGEAVIFEGTTADGFEITLDVADPTADRTIALPDTSGTLVTTGDTGTVTNTMLAGSIDNNKLSNSTITVDGVPVSLGGSISIAGADFDWTGAHEFIDENFTIKDNSDPTKEVRFQAALISSGSTVRLNLPDENLGTLATQNWVDGRAVNITGDTMTGRLTLSADPTSAMHAATKQYVDDNMATSAYWIGSTSNPTASLSAYSDYPRGTIVAMSYSYSYTYWAGNGNATANATERRTYIKKNTENNWQLIATQ